MLNKSISKNISSRVTLRFFAILASFLVFTKLFLARQEFESFQSLIPALLTLIVTIYIPFFINAINGKKFDFFWPPNFFAVIIILGYVLPLPKYVVQEDVMSKMWPYNFSNISNSVNFALWIACAGTLAFYVGFFCPIPRKSLSFNYTVGKNSLKFLIIIYSTIGISLFSTGIMLIGGFQALTTGLSDRNRLFAGLNYLFYGVLLVPIIAFVWWIALIKNKKLLNIPFIIFAIVSLSISGLLGSKANTFIILLAGIFVFHISYKRIRAMWFLLLLFAGVFVLAGFELYFREFLVIGKIVSFSFNSLFSLPLELFDKVIEGNFLQIQVLSIISDAVPEKISMQFGSTYLYLLSAPIPSLFWSAKPISPSGVFTIPIWPDQWFVNGTTMPPSLMGEMYMNFGVLGIIFGMVLFGGYYQYLYKKASQKNPRISHIVLYSFSMAMMVHYMRGNFADPTVLLIIFVIPTLFAARYVFKEKAIEHSRKGVV